ncbi:MAG: helix-turn-helix transcriptional regulator [Bacteroidia bacterium]
MISKKKFLKQFGAHIKNLREEQQLTQAELSNAINKDRQSLQRLEKGNINPSIYYLYELATGLEIDIDELLDFKPDKK